MLGKDKKFPSQRQRTVLLIAQQTSRPPPCPWSPALGRCESWPRSMLPIAIEWVYDIKRNPKHRELPILWRGLLDNLSSPCSREGPCLYFTGPQQTCPISYQRYYLCFLRLCKHPWKESETKTDLRCADMSGRIVSSCQLSTNTRITGKLVPTHIARVNPQRSWFSLSEASLSACIP